MLNKRSNQLQYTVKSLVSYFNQYKVSEELTQPPQDMEKVWLIWLKNTGVLLLLIKCKLDLVELGKNSGAINGLVLNLISLPWLKEWVMGSLWVGLLPEKKLWLSIKRFSLIPLEVGIFSHLLEWKSLKLSDKKTYIWMLTKLEVILWLN